MPRNFARIAPYNCNRDHRQWRKLAWTEIHSDEGQRYTIDRRRESAEQVVRV